MRVNSTREKLSAGRPVLGTFLRYPDPGLAELLAVHGFDFVVFDGEHGPLTPLACENLARAVELHGVTPIARVERNEPATIMRYLDAGAQTCHVPGVASAEDAERAVRALKYPPRGERGLAGTRAGRYGVGHSLGEYVAAADRETQLVVHIETLAGVEAVEEIAAVDGVDVLLFGAVDLSADLGHPGETERAEMREHAKRVAAAAARSGKVLGAAPGDAEAARSWLDRGARYLVTTVESLLRPGIAAILEAR